MRVPFIKMHGLGNDFVVLDGRENRLPPVTNGFARALADRRTGIGCDQLIVLEPSDAADFRMRIHNSNGGEVEACGNATRAVALLHGQPARIETDPLFPEGVNVNVATVENRGEIRLRVWERGAGLTQACGTGACATAVVAMRRKLVEREVMVTLPGGRLLIGWGEDNRITMTGPAAESFRGSFDWGQYA